MNLYLATSLLLASVTITVIPPSSKNYEFNFGTENIPHPAKIEKGGEDAYYGNKYVLCVADGVGSWASEGVDAGKYSRKLTSNVAAFFAEEPAKFTAKPKDLIVKATLENHEIGSSTIVIVIINPETGVANASKVGDSCYIILRPDPLTGKLFIFYRSKEQQHGFNFPYQVGTDGDSPLTAVEFSHQLMYGDIVVVGSDGMFDNLYDETTLEEVEKLKDTTPGDIARRLAQLSFKLSLNRKYFSPFAKAGRESNFPYMGGKSDDIAVVVGIVIKPQPTEEPKPKVPEEPKPQSALVIAQISKDSP